MFLLLDVFPLVQNLEKKKDISVKSSYKLSFAKKKRRNFVGFYQIYNLFIRPGLILLLLRYKGRLPLPKGAYQWRRP